LGGSCDKDIVMVESQLKRKIDNFNKVSCRCVHGFPAVIESLPVRNGRPFPTLYWLTCPFLRKAISTLESQGWIRYFEETLKRDSAFRSRHLRANREVSHRRSLLFTGSYDEYLSKLGTGGIRDLMTVKCLHLHVADFLSGVDNPIGETVVGVLNKLWCENGDCGHELV